MSDTVAVDIPYERQNDPTSNRMCGAAALCMVYRSFGMSASQAELAPRLREPGAPSASSARSHLLAQDALAHGLSAVVLRARDPLRSLRRHRDPAIRLILNHRLHHETASGHFTVLVQVREREAVVHDPQRGPHTRLMLADLAELWRPLGPRSEITGHVLLAVAKARAAATACPTCGRTPPDAIMCPGCRKPFPIHPTSVLGCMEASCDERMWDALFCPYCDTGVTGAVVEGAISAAGKETTDGPDPQGHEDLLRLDELSREIDNFIAVLLKVSRGAPAPALQEQIAVIRTCQEQMLAFQRKDADERRARAAQAEASIPSAAPAREPAPPPKPAPSSKPPAAEEPRRQPVDWNDLSRRLVEEVRRRSG